MKSLNFSLLKISLSIFFILLLLSCNSKENVNSEKNDEIVLAQKTEIQPKSEIREEIHGDTVVISGMEFHPAVLNVKKGASIVWINKDIVVHDVTDFPNKKWTSGALQPGNSWKMKVENDFDYFCSIHITMKGKIVLDN